MKDDPKHDALLETSRAPGYRKVKRVRPSRARRHRPQGARPGPRPRDLIRKERYTSANSCSSNGSACGRMVWLLGAFESDLREPGDYVCTEIGRESVLIVRQTDGGVRAFYNVCMHRGNRLRPAGAGSTDTFKCQYHHWEYETSTAAFKRIPDLDTFPQGAPPCRGLNELPCDTWGGFVWFSLTRSRAAARIPRPDAEHLDPYNFHEDGAHARHHGRVGLQLEGLGRRVQRELPRAGHSPAADVVPARPRHPDRLLRAAQPLPDPVRDAGARASASRRRSPTRSR